ncbi:MAG TPA: GNAT family N-acetyltransferase [Marmoricola sp.]|nr:GNAT family N-acetyltransferase [Marmoricola sp.]
MPLVRVPTLSDGVVTLRGHTDGDIDAVVEQSRDPLSRRWTKVPDPYDRDDARRFVRDVMPGGWASDQEWGFAVEAADDGTPRYAGTVSLRSEGAGRAEIAYGAHPWARGRGVMERALRLLLEWGFSPVRDGGRELDTVIWWAEVGNWASRRLAWRVGFGCDGIVRRWLRNRDGRVDAWVGSLYREDARTPRTPWLEVPRIEGERVRLRMHRPDDLDRMYEGATDPVTSYWLGRIPDPYSAEEAGRFLRDRSAGMAAGTDLHWMLADPDTDLLLGTISLMHLAEGMAEIGYWSHPEARGRGVMTEAVQMACRHALIAQEDGGLGLHRLYAVVAVDNRASRRVLERAGFGLVGTERRSVIVRDGMHDGAAYELLVDDLRRTPA